MTQSLAVFEDIRNHINFVEEKQNEVTNEALGDIVGKAKTWWAGRGQRAGSKELDYFTNEHAKWLGVLMGRQGIDYPKLTLGNMRNYLKTNNINLDDDEIKQIFDKVGKEYALDDVSDDTVISTDKAESQQIAKSVIRQGIMKAVSKQGLGQPGTKTQQQGPAQPATSPEPAPTSATTQSSASAAQPSKPSASTAATQPIKPASAQATPSKPFSMVVDIGGKNVTVKKVTPSKIAPAGWYYWDPKKESWIYPSKNSEDAKIFNQLYTAKTTPAVKESTQQEVKSRTDDLVAARQAEQQGDKATQYEKLADYHEKFSKVKKLKPADRVHHTTQAGIYRNAAQAVRSAQETLNKSSK